MRNAIASKIEHAQTDIGQILARRGVDLLLSIDEGNALVQCQVNSAIAAAMLAPLGGAAVGQFRALSGGLVEIDAAVTLPMAARMLEARDATFCARQQLH
jgi:hypothetical protein